MLVQLTIRNFALIESLQIDPGPGLNVFTGETGAGKSIVIDALCLVLGARFDMGQLRQREEVCSVEAIFRLEDAGLCQHELFREFLDEGEDLLILRREIQAEGKTKSSVNRRLVNLTTLKEIARYLIDIHGQHDQQAIFDPVTHLEILDRLAASSREGELFETWKKEYRHFYREYHELISRKQALLDQQSGREREVDLLSYQVREIENVKPVLGEEEALKEEQIRLAHAEKLYELTSGILQKMEEDEYAATGRIAEALREWTRWTRIDESAGKNQAEMEALLTGLEEGVRFVRDYREGLSYDDDRLRVIQERLGQIETLKRKYGGSIGEILKFLLEAKQKLDLLANSEGHQKDIETQLEALVPKMKAVVDRISARRKKAGDLLSETIEKELADLAIRHGKFECRFEKGEYGPHGREQASFYFSPNLGEAVMPLAKIASGGEASRVMLAIKKALAKADTVPTLIFDEIDSNIGGRLGDKVGQKMKDIAEERQVLAITHLPQIASFAATHWKLSKKVQGKRTVVVCERLEGDAKVQELSHMMSGERESKISKAHAREMLKSAVE